MMVDYDKLVPMEVESNEVEPKRLTRCSLSPTPTFILALFGIVLSSAAVGALLAPAPVCSAATSAEIHHGGGALSHAAAEPMHCNTKGWAAAVAGFRRPLDPLTEAALTQGPPSLLAALPLNWPPGAHLHARACGGGVGWDGLLAALAERSAAGAVAGPLARPKYTFLVVGGSMTLGQDAEVVLSGAKHSWHEAAWPGALGRGLQAAFPGVEVVVINRGTSGYNSLAALPMLPALLAEAPGADAIIIDFSVNDWAEFRATSGGLFDAASVEQWVLTLRRLRPAMLPVLAATCGRPSCSLVSEGIRELASHYRLPYFSYLRAGDTVGEPEADLWHAPRGINGVHPDA